MAGSLFAPDFREQPYWWDAAEPATWATAVPDRTGVAIIGGGYAGLSAALTLRRLGHDVTVLDAERIGWGASSRNGGMVSGKVQLGADALNRLVGPEKAAEITSTCAAALPFIEETIAREGIDCDYVRVGRFTGACTPKQFDTQAGNVARMAEMSGLPARMVAKAEQQDFIGSDHYHGGMVSDATGSLHPGKYARGLAQAAEQAGAVLVDHARVRGVTRDGSGFRVATERFEIRADTVLMATNGYSLGPGSASAMPWLARRLVPVASYIIATEPMPRETIERLFPKLRMMGETRRVLNYFRPSPDGTRVIWGGRASFRSVSAFEAAPALHASMTQVFPELASTRITHAWNGNVAFTFDHLPHIGVQDGIHYAAGCQGSGVAMATWLGHNVALKMAGAANTVFPLDGLRFPTRPFYDGDPWWVLPILGNWYRLRDRIDQARVS
jgi:glycine/D-amino acid oxidase-like deaminating enzyme